MDTNALGRLIIVTGIALVMVGLIVLGMGHIPGFKHIGRLPGDIRIERGSVTCFAPLVSMLLLSLLLSLVLTIVLRVLNR